MKIAITMTMQFSFHATKNQLNDIIFSESNEEMSKNQVFSYDDPVDGILSHRIRLYFSNV